MVLELRQFQYFKFFPVIFVIFTPFFNVKLVQQGSEREKMNKIKEGKRKRSRISVSGL